MNKKAIIGKTIKYVKAELNGEGSEHDWWHVYRVWQNAKYIGKTETADMFIVELAALLHDIADWKLHGGDDNAGPRAATAWLKHLHVDQTTSIEVCEIIKGLSFKGAKVKAKKLSREGQVVQDADRLDAIGAIGIARAFAYGGHAGRLMYDPDVKPVLHRTAAAYKKNQGHTINHFYEKLLLLKNRMNTGTARRIATSRHNYMVKYLQQFYGEWAGKK